MRITKPQADQVAWVTQPNCTGMPQERMLPMANGWSGLFPRDHYVRALILLTVLTSLWWCNVRTELIDYEGRSEDVTFRGGKENPSIFGVFLALSFLGIMAKDRGWSLFLTSLAFSTIPVFLPLYFWNEYSGIVGVAIAVGILCRGGLSDAILFGFRVGLPRLYWGVLGLQCVSLIANAISQSDSFLLKTGVIKIIMTLIQIGAILSMLSSQSRRSGFYEYLLKSWRLAAVIALVPGLIGTYVITFGNLPYSPDTGYGLVYFRRLTSTFNDPNSACLFYACSLPLFFNKRRDSLSAQTRLFYLTCVFLLLLLVIATGSRAGKVAVGAIFFAALSIPSLRGSVWVPALIGSMILAMTWSFRSLRGGEVVEFGGAISFVERRSEEGFFVDDDRMRDVTVGLQMSARSFLFGYGPGTPGMGDLPQPHNQILSAIFELGILGGILHLSLLVGSLAVLWRLKSSRHPEIASASATLFPAMVGYVVMSQFHSPSSHMLFAFLIGLTSVLVLAERALRWSDLKSQFDTKALLRPASRQQETTLSVGM